MSPQKGGQALVKLLRVVVESPSLEVLKNLVDLAFGDMV